MPYLIKRCCVVLMLVAATASTALADTGRCTEWAGKAVSVQGTVEYRASGEDAWRQVGPEEALCPGDTVRVGAQSRASLQLRNQSVMRLNENTAFTLAAAEQEGRPFLVEMLQGAAHFLSRKPRSLDVNTPYTIAGVRGTEFSIAVADGRTDLIVFEGMVLAQNQHGQVELTSGQAAVAMEGQAPARTVLVRPRDAVQWALYYPQIGTPEKKDPGIRPEAYDSAQRASELLAVGQAGRANEELERALKADPNFAEAYALQSIIALVQNEGDRAGALADRAVQARPESASAWLAQSYVQQSRFDVEGARASREKAVQAEPQNALAWAALAESWTMTGNLNKALEAAQRAAQLQPDLPQTQKVLGFVHLMQVRTDQARQAFQRAVELDQADPMPRLGLGLAEFRDGDVAEGQRQMEIAASLDPNRSLIRSYLGKAFFEQKRTDIALREFDIAKELDPNDPTPWFYSAVAQQTTNRPVEAMQDYQKAIELNDNRAVYRSRLLLDSDLAARSAALGRLYGELGFEQLALSEGFKAVNEDPSNFSAHRFLADLYGSLPRHEIARVSALLQSQLLQPINLTPIQPTLAESNLLLISAMGPTALSFNEFNPLFEQRQRVAFLGSGLVGENDTWAGEGVLSAIIGRMSLSGGYTHFETDGWRENAYQEDDIYNLFAQYEIAHNTSIQVEFRNRNTDFGDTKMRFFENEFMANLDQTREASVARLGLRHEILPGHTLIGNFSYTDYDDSADEINEESFIPFIGLGTEAISRNFELSYLSTLRNIKLISGAGYVYTNRNSQLQYSLALPPPPDGPGRLDFSTAWDETIKHTNAYLYSHINLPLNMILTLGLSGDIYDTNDELLDNDQLNPKIGLIWNILPKTTLRVAGFRTLTRTLPTDQTLEPTQVSGFNQFYDDTPGTDAWRYGIGLDQKITNNINVGVEYSLRDLEIPFVIADDEGANRQKTDLDEKFFRAYVYWTPLHWTSITTEAYWEKHDGGEEIGEFKELETWWFPIGINIFLHNGLSASLKATYYNQEGSFTRLEAPLGYFEDGSEHFWLVDASLNFRLPNRYGFITLGVKNLFDENFRFFDIDPHNPRIKPDRFTYIAISFALP
jgi:tetratricopeptide (TPR) repeat protein